MLHDALLADLRLALNLTASRLGSSAGLWAACASRSTSPYPRLNTREVESLHCWPSVGLHVGSLASRPVDAEGFAPLRPKHGDSLHRV